MEATHATPENNTTPVSFITINISDIIIETRQRDYNENKAKAIAESIQEIGLLQPILISPDNVLIAGRHRIGAYESLGKSYIPAIVKNYTEIDAKLAEIDENLVRFELTAMERTLQLHERQTLFHAKYPSTLAGGKREKGKTIEHDVPTFAEDTADKTGKSVSEVYRETKLGNDLNEKTTEEIRELIAPTNIAKNKKDLERLLDHPIEVQEEIASIISDAHKDGKKVSVQQALNQMQGDTTKTDSSEFLKIINSTEKKLEKIMDSVDLADVSSYWTDEGKKSIIDQLESIKRLCELAMGEIKLNL